MKYEKPRNEEGNKGSQNETESIREVRKEIKKPPRILGTAFIYKKNS